MFEFKNVLNKKDNLIQFLQVKIMEIFIVCWFYKGKTWDFLDSF